MRLPRRAADAALCAQQKIVITLRRRRNGGAGELRGHGARGEGRRNERIDLHLCFETRGDLAAGERGIVVSHFIDASVEERARDTAGADAERLRDVCQSHIVGLRDEIEAVDVDSQIRTRESAHDVVPATRNECCIRAAGRGGGVIDEKAHGVRASGLNEAVTIAAGAGFARDPAIRGRRGLIRKHPRLQRERGAGMRGLMRHADDIIHAIEVKRGARDARRMCHGARGGAVMRALRILRIRIRFPKADETAERRWIAAIGGGEGRVATRDLPRINGAVVNGRFVDAADEVRTGDRRAADLQRSGAVRDGGGVGALGGEHAIDIQA